MIPIPSGVKVWIATGVTDMRRGMNGLSLQVTSQAAPYEQWYEEEPNHPTHPHPAPS